MVTVSRRRSVDLGRLIMVPAAAVMLLLDFAALSRGGSTAAIRWPGAALVCAFYLLIIWNYLRRGPAVATSGSITGSAAAVVATLAPFTFPLLAGGQPGRIRPLSGDLLLVAGLAWSVWALRCLGQNLSVIAQAREVAEHGPYRLVRHPLYTGEIVSALGLAIAAGTLAAFAVWLALGAMQVYRAVREEQILLSALPGYRDYRARTAALVPGLF
jgi:protein-S-isoprenylcysteine O-methyltransferase Ste14